ncbi:GIY-YIG nuclease family protein [Ferruginibacter sp. SUN106]|uniref:GIY-YIG nuclease family protein n=1 Tax=Ferruginibacter sp. SUN106 TaxID=2978348 RepID=UPI003D35D483
MSCYVYFLYSDELKKYYVGVSNDVSDRLKRHNSGQSLSTKAGLPWKLIFTIECVDKSAAMQLEIKIKKRGIRRFLVDNNIQIEL